MTPRPFDTHPATRYNRKATDMNGTNGTNDMRIKTPNFKALVAAALLALAGTTHAQNADGYTHLPWDKESTDQTIGNVSWDVMHGDVLYFTPRLTDSGVGRPWPTNTAFVMNYATPSMVFSNQWWTNNAITFPVYHNVNVASTTGVVYYIVTNTWTYTTTNTFLYNNNGVVTNVTVYTNAALVTSTNTFTNQVRYTAVVSAIDAGKVDVLWGGTAMDYFAEKMAYTCRLGAWVGGTNIGHTIWWTMNMKPSPGWLPGVAPVPANYATNYMTHAEWLSASNALYVAITNEAAARQAANANLQQQITALSSSGITAAQTTNIAAIVSGQTGVVILASANSTLVLSGGVWRLEWQQAAGASSEVVRVALTNEAAIRAAEDILVRSALNSSGSLWRVEWQGFTTNWIAAYSNYAANAFDAMGAADAAKLAITNDPHFWASLTNAALFDAAGAAAASGTAFSNYTDAAKLAITNDPHFWKSLTNGALYATAAQGGYADDWNSTKSLYTTFGNVTNICNGILSVSGYATQGWVMNVVEIARTNAVDPTWRANSNALTTALQPVSTQGMATVTYVDTATNAAVIDATNRVAGMGYLPLSGGIMTGDLFFFYGKNLILQSPGEIVTFGVDSFTDIFSLLFQSTLKRWTLPTPTTNLTFSSTADVAVHTNLTLANGAHGGLTAAGIAAAGGACITSGSAATNIWAGTSAAFSALATTNASTIYLVY